MRQLIEVARWGVVHAEMVKLWYSYYRESHELLEPMLAGGCSLLRELAAPQLFYEKAICGGDRYFLRTMLHLAPIHLSKNYCSDGVIYAEFAGSVCAWPAWRIRRQVCDDLLHGISHVV